MATQLIGSCIIFTGIYMDENEKWLTETDENTKRRLLHGMLQYNILYGHLVRTVVNCVMFILQILI